MNKNDYEVIDVRNVTTTVSIKRLTPLNKIATPTTPCLMEL
jgi:hypothetical protein